MKPVVHTIPTCSIYLAGNMYRKFVFCIYANYWEHISA